MAALCAVVALAVGAAAPGAASSAAPTGTKGPYGDGQIRFTNADGTVTAGPGFTLPGAQVLTGDFVGSDFDDIFFYTPGAGGDLISRSNGDGTFSSMAVSVSGTYTPLVGSFADNDGKDDILWYAPGTAADSLWDFNEDGTITTTSLTINGTYTPLVGDFSDDVAQDVVWYSPGTGTASWWKVTSSGDDFLYKAIPLSVPKDARTAVAFFAGQASPSFDGISDILFYGPGAAADSLWDFNDDESITKSPLTIDGDYTLVPGDFSHDGYNDVILYTPGTGADRLWNFTGAGGAHTSTALTIDGRFTPVTCRCIGQSPQETDIAWFGAGSSPDRLWDFNYGTAYTSRPLTLTGSRRPAVGSFKGAVAPVAGDGTHYEAGDDFVDVGVS
ncbi:hypothetical protein KSP35_12835 [Aquihabitans sp. G128]|uniref:hypothetical protein n=1 Tax=Aquihabitans sp. G128 TaxID=2849779 RepID=UPI001C21A7AC|nr:hypothetical protein [Aquihabitans sp. G128]QXC59290.1 hypothetical protein KSP35_12835 [Aquihabitans sp. G128]